MRLPAPAEIAFDLPRCLEKAPRLLGVTTQLREHRLSLDQLRPDGRPDAELLHQPAQHGLGLHDGQR